MICLAMLKIVGSIKLSIDRQLGLIFCLILSIATYFAVVNSRKLQALVFTCIILFILIVITFIPRKFRIVTCLWMKIGTTLGKFTNPILLGLIYYLLITSTAIFLRIIGRDRLKLKEYESMWTKPLEQSINYEYFTRKF